MPAARAPPRSTFRSSASAASARAATGATVVLFVSDPVAPVCGSDALLGERLRAVYRLTPAESAVAIALADGGGLAAVAATLGVSLATVRTQAQHVYRKTGVRGQAALASLVARLAQVR